MNIDPHSSSDAAPPLSGEQRDPSVLCIPLARREEFVNQLVGVSYSPFGPARNQVDADLGLLNLQRKFFFCRIEFP